MNLSINRSIGLTEDLKKYQPMIFGKKPNAEPGSSLHNEWWEEHVYHMTYGLKPKGLSPITGHHYAYLNNWPILANDPNSTAEEDRKVLTLPFYRDMDHIYFNAVKECKVDRCGLMVVKARDKGFSMMNASIASTEYQLYDSNEVGLAAGLDTTAQSLAGKVRNMIERTWLEMRMGTLKDNDKIIHSGFEVKRLKQWMAEGMNSKIHIRTMNNPNVFKGERLGVMIFEEAGEFERLLEAYMASEPCFRDGSKFFGLPIVGGTGGDINKASKDFKHMWYHAESFNLRQLFIPATKVYSGFFDFTTGVSDDKGAKEHVLTERKKLEAANNTQGLNLHIQNYPLDADEAFIKSSGGIFNIHHLNAILRRIVSDKNIEKKIERGFFEWDYDKMPWLPANIKSLSRDKRNEIIFTSNQKPKVKFVDDRFGHTRILHHPFFDRHGNHLYKGMHCSGIDSVDQEQAETSDSKLSCVVYRRFTSVDIAGNLPVAIMHYRTDSPAEMYEQALMMNIYYDSMALIEYTKFRIIETWERWFADQMYAVPRPDSLLSPESKQRQKYGIMMTTDVKETMISLIKEELSEYRDHIWFVELVRELMEFLEINTDIAMAYGLAVLNKRRMLRIVAEEQESQPQFIRKVEWVQRNGKLIQVVVEKPNPHYERSQREDEHVPQSGGSYYASRVLKTGT